MSEPQGPRYLGGHLVARGKVGATVPLTWYNQEAEKVKVWMKKAHDLEARLAAATDLLDEVQKATVPDDWVIMSARWTEAVHSFLADSWQAT